MKIFCDKSVGFGFISLSGGAHRKLAASFICKTELPLVDTKVIGAGACIASLVVGDVIDSNKELIYSSDFVPFKPRADVILSATAYSSDRKPHIEIEVRFAIGDIGKSLRIRGDRTWQSDLVDRVYASRTTEFMSMPIRYARAFGGTRYRFNPIGTGHNSETAHNIEDMQWQPKGPNDNGVVAGFGPIHCTWPQRAQYLGTYDDEWLKKNWPWFPDDFDWSYFNSAPRDQQIDGYLRGDEEMEFHNLHPEFPVFRSRLPGIRGRCFIEIREKDGRLKFREVVLKCDTLSIDLEEQKMVLVWRGMTPVHSLKMKEVERVFAFTEPLSAPTRSIEESAEYVYARFLTPQEEESAEAAPVTTESDEAEFDAAFKQMDEAFAKAEAEAEAAKHEAQVDAILKEQQQKLVVSGEPAFDLDTPVKPSSLATMREQLAAQLESLEKSSPESVESLKSAIAELTELEKDQAEAEAEFKAMDDEAGAEGEKVWTRQAVVEAFGRGESFSQQNLRGLDLSQLDLSGADFSAAILSKVNFSTAKLTDTVFKNADLREANLTDANLTRAKMDDADLAKSNLAGATLFDLSLESATLSGLNLKGSDFSRSFGKGTDFSGSDFSKATLRDTKFPQCDFSGCQMPEADFSGAELHAAQFDGAQGPKIVMEGADVAGIHAGRGSNFSKGNFRNLKGAGSIWEEGCLDGADFTSALLKRAQFSEASLIGTVFNNADLEKAVFEDAVATGAQFLRANLLRAALDRVNLGQADLRGANLFEVGLWDTQFADTNLGGANIKRTLLTVKRGN